MLTIIFAVLMFLVFGKLFLFALKACWGITKILVSIVFLPLFLIGLFVTGFFYIALIVLFVVGIFSLIAS